MLADEVADVTRQLFQALLRILEAALHPHLHVHHVTREVHQAEMQARRLYVHPHHIGRIRIQPVERGGTAFVRLLLSIIHDVSLFHQLHDELGHGRDTQIYIFCQVREGGRMVMHQISDNPLLGLHVFRTASQSFYQSMYHTACFS